MKKLLVFTMAMVCTFVTAQELPDVTPISPEAASIGKYGQVPVGLFTGTPQVNVPIYTFSSGQLKVPVSLNYSSNGLRVDEYGSSVGLGWNLSAGGVITRSVYGKKDENQYRPAKDVDLNIGEERYFYASAAADPGSEGIDTQPDIFSFNFNGYSGKFYLDDNDPFFTNRDVIFLEPSPVKVEILNVGTEHHFKITDPSGIVYYFGGENAIEKFRYDSTNQADNPENQPLVPSAWFLTKITHLSGEEIIFSYDRGSVIYKNSISQSISKVDGFYNDSSYCISTSSDQAYLNIAQGYFAYLTEISSITSGKVIFEYSQKQFMPSGFKQLDKITINNVSNNNIKSFDLRYLIAEATGPTNQDIIQENYYNKRYFLSSVLEKSNAGGTNINPYVFEYDNPQNLPSRFSYTQDYWGFYNGKNLNRNLIDQDIVDKLSSNFVLGNALNDFVGADRNPDSVYGKLGMLSAITYPTKGKNEFTYEGHSYFGEVITDPEYVSQIATVTETNTTGSFEVLNILENHKGWLNFGANLDDFAQGIGDPNNNLDFNIAEIDVFDITNGTEVAENIYDESDIHGWSPISGLEFGITNLNFTKRKYVKLKKDHSYRFKIRLSNGYTLSHIKLDYFNQLPVVTNENIPVGGMRISRVNALDGNGKIETKTYHYGTMDCLDCDSGKIIERNIEPTVSTNRVIYCLPNDGPNPSESCPSASCGSTTISSNTAFPLYGIQGYHIGYTNVIEEFGNDFLGGAKEHQFEGDFNIAPNVVVFGEEYVPGLPYSNFYGFGRKIGEKVYSKNEGQFKIVQEIINEYTHKLDVDKETTIYAVRQAGRFLQGVAFADDPNYTFQNSQYHISQYSLFRQWHVMSKRTSINYDHNGEHPITTTEDFFYDNSQHLQQNRTETTDSKGRLIKTQTTYPQDIPVASRTVAEQKLIDLHKIATPIDIVSSEKEGSSAAKTISKVHTEYQDWGNNLILPKEVETSKKTSALDLRVTYNSYDSFGNPQEVSKATGAPVVYIWGYHHQYPVAKLENITYDEIQSYVADIQTKSNADIDRTIGTLGTEGTLRTALNDLRNALPDDVMVSTYTYDPTVGITSMTDPRGYTMYYEYDTHNRLQFVRDEEGKLVSENKYHYKN